MESQKSIIKSTSVIASVQILKILFVFIQNKALAIIIGTAGYGIYGLFYTFSTMISSFATVGVDQASVRQVAKNKNELVFGKTLWSIYFLLFSTSIFFFSIITFFRNRISVSLFGSESYSQQIIVIAVAILFNGLSQGFISILNGLQKIKYIALSQIFGVLTSTICSIIFIYYYKIEGIPYFILFASIVVFLFSFFYVKKIKLPLERPSFVFLKKESTTILSIGAGLAYSAVIVSVFSYLSQIYIRENFGLEWVGMFNASNIISNVYLGIILTAMGVDLLPRLVQTINDKSETSKLIDFQIGFGLIFSTIGIIIILAFSNEFISLIYSDKFTGAKSIIKWHVMSAGLKILSYPLGYILIVKRQTVKYIIVQTTLWGGSYLLMVYLTKIYGTNALGADFFTAFIVYLVIMYLFTKKNYKISKSCVFIIIVSWVLIFVAAISNAVFVYSRMLLVINILLILITLLWSNYALRKYLDLNIIDLLRTKFINK